MRKAINIVPLALLLGAALAISALGQKPADRYVDTTGGFSVTPPPGWVAGTGDSASVILGPVNAGIAPNFNSKAASSPLTLRKFADGSITFILVHHKEMGTDSTVVYSKTAFVTSAHVTGVRVILVSMVKGTKIRQAQYYFGKGDTKYILTFTALDSDRATNDKLFDASVKTFAIDK